MKKVLVVIALMIFSSQLFAQEETQKHREVDGKGRPAIALPWLVSSPDTYA